jgi:3-oxoacyl-[acyl-carrier protein] reductase
MSIAIDLSDQAALVTGSSQGIGAAIARTLHEAGARVVINHPDQADGRTRADALDLAGALNQARPQSAMAIAANVARAEEVERMMGQVKVEWGGLDILVNNAGILRDRTLAKMSPDEWQAVLDVNLTGVFHGCKFGLAVLRDGGAIVNVGSLSAAAGFYGQANYAAAKAGVQALSRVLSRECARRGIRVNAVAPGLIETSMTASIPENIRDEMRKAIPAGRLGMPREVAGAVLLLCSPLASYITGHTLRVDGGWRG